jgi:predicted site-specific integrase-resolvase
LADLTTKQVAEILQCDAEQVRRYIRVGYLRAKRQANGRFTVAEEDLRRFRDEIAGRFF